jgi:SAM domain (Sterile alpha motif)
MALKDPAELEIEEVLQWLTAIGFESKVPTFQENAIDGHMLVKYVHATR